MVNKLAFVVFILSFVVTTHSIKDISGIEIDQEDNNSSIPDHDDYILCRNCGCDISSSTYLFSKLSFASREAFNDTLFTKDEVLVQILTSDVIFHFPVVTTIQSTCVSVGQWQDQDSWFPGYRWKPCVCPDCGSYVGYVFEPINPEETPNRIFGLILTNIIGEKSNLSAEDQAFLDKCEQELKYRFTEQDEEFMKVFNAEPTTPPILETWYVSQGGRRNDRWNNRSFHPYERYGRDNRERNYDRRDNYRRDNYDRRGHADRGYDNRRYDDRYQGHRNQYPR